jgi:cytochrome b pre-mRNA-processing protein 3
MILKRLFAAKTDPSRALYDGIVAAARQERFYADWGVPDTVDGRFDMIALHLYLVLDRLKGRDGAAGSLGQALTDAFFLDMDRSLREMGVGDLAVGKKVRKMAEAFYGRVTAYDAAVKAGEAALQAALARNVYAGADASQAPKLAAWAAAVRASLAGQSDTDLAAGTVRFP